MSTVRSFRSWFDISYDIEHSLGSGGFGTVYKCKQKLPSNSTEEEKLVAVKTVEFQTKEEEKVLQEIKMLADLSHPHVVQIFNSWVEYPPKKYKYHCFTRKEATIGVIFIETEYCSLNSLRYWFRKAWRKKEQAKIFMYQITSGVKYLHEKGIIHRDLKPENVLLQNESSSNSIVAKICDFGVSRQTATVMTSMVGTFGYISPEVLRKTNYDKKADVYSLGVMFYEMLLLGDVKNEDLRLSGKLNAMMLNEMANYVFKFLPEDEDLIELEEKCLIERMVEVDVENRLDVNAVAEKLFQLYPDIDKLKILNTPDIQISTLKAADNENENVTSTKTLTKYFVVKNYLKNHTTNLFANKPEQSTGKEVASEIMENKNNPTLEFVEITPPGESNFQTNEQPIKKPTNEIENAKYWQEKYSSFLSVCNSSDAMNILSLLSFLHPNDIHTTFVNQIFKEINPLLKKLFPSLSKYLVSLHGQVDVFEILEQHSLCRRRKVEDKDFIYVDPILQEVIRRKLEEEEKLVEMLDKLLDIIYKMLQANGVAWTDLLQVETFWKHAAKIKLLVEKHNNVPNQIAYQYQIAGRYKEGFNFCCKAVKNLQVHLGIKHRSTLIIMNWKGAFHENLEEYEDALRTQLEVYNKQKSLFGEADEDTLITARQIGIAYYRQKNLEEAKKWFGEALKKTETKLGKEHTTIFSLKSDLAIVLLDEGKYQEAEKLYQEILLLHEKVFGRDDINTLTVKHNIALSKERQGNYDEALTIYEQVLEIQEKVLGKQHPYTLITKSSIERTKKNKRNEMISNLNSLDFSLYLKITVFIF